MMKKVLYAGMILSMPFLVCCNGQQAKPIISMNDSVEVEMVADSTLYGVCGESTTMHVLQMITDAGDTLSLLIEDGDPGTVQGGLLAGDRIAVIAKQDAEEGMLAQRVINLTSLLGRWTSIDKNFEIVEGGEVMNSIGPENANSWTSWKILNGKLLLNKDTFTINHLGPDSLYIENNVGIFTFKRSK